MSTQVDRTFARLERRTERIVAVLRLLALCVLALVFWLVGVLDPGQITMVPFGGLFLTTLIGLVAAGRSLSSLGCLGCWRHSTSYS